MFKPKYDILLTLLFFIALLCNSCKKYPQDEHYSLHTVKTRISGTYILDKYIVNGIDSTCLIPPRVAVNTLKYGKTDGNYYFYFDRFGNIHGTGDESGLFNFNHSTNKDIICIGYSAHPQVRNVLNPFKGNDGCWKILKATTTQFWLTLDYLNYNVEIHLKKIHKYNY